MSGAEQTLRERRLSIAGATARHSLFRRLAAAGRGDPNDIAVAGMCATWASGGGALPQWMGLPPTLFRKMLDHHFGAAGREVAGGRASSEEGRLSEVQDLRDMLLASRARRAPSERWLVDLISAGCMGYDHLWSDLGLMSRPELTGLMRANFPRLAERNTENMRWKRFLYKMLCEGDGWYICRAPTCQECSERPACFAVEEE
ncbi:MAG: nitrogen fixation protein NifQ [Pseudomonadota bacterium]